MNYRQIAIASLQTSGMFLAGLVIPLLGQLITLFTPVPLILLTARHSRRDGMIALIASCALIAVLGGWQTAAVLFFSFGLMAFGVSEGMTRQWKPESASLLGGMLPVMMLAVVTLYYFARIDKNPVLVLEEYLKNNLGEAAKLYTQLGFAEMASVISSISDTVIHYLVRLLPGITIATTVFQAATCYGISTIILNRRPAAARALAPVSLARWHAPDVWVWGLIAGLILIMVPVEAAYFTGLNLALIYTVVYLTQGIAIVDHYLRKGRVQPFVRGLLHTLILALPSIVFVIALGVVDIWADFRKVRATQEAAR